MPDPEPAAPDEPEAVDTLVEHMGRVAQADGLPRIAGRLFGFLIIHAGPYSLGELAQRLAVSRASISTNTRLLEQLGVLERVSRPGDRQDYYQLHPAPYPALMRGVVERNREARSGVARARSALPQSWNEARGRLEALETFYERVCASCEAVIASYDAEAEEDPRD